MVKAVRWISFNPRSYKRSDLSSKCLSYFFFSFNPRSYKRSDVTRSPILIPFSDFQSTLLQEERHPTRTPHANPHILSIHAPTRGATFPFSVIIPLINRLSIHAPTRGATVFYITICISFLFQSTLLQEERL